MQEGGWRLWLHSLKVAQLLRSAACLHTNQSRSYLNHLVYRIGDLLTSWKQRAAKQWLLLLLGTQISLIVPIYWLFYNPYGHRKIYWAKTRFKRAFPHICRLLFLPVCKIAKLNMHYNLFLFCFWQFINIVLKSIQSRTGVCLRCMEFCTVCRHRRGVPHSAEVCSPESIPLPYSWPCYLRGIS